MAIEQNELFNKQYQVRLLAHILRCRNLLQYLVDGKVTQDDFPIGIHKAILASALECVRFCGETPGIGILQETLYIPLRAQISASIILPEEVDALCNTIAAMYAMELQPEFYSGLTGGLTQFLYHQRCMKAVKEETDAEALSQKLARAKESSKIARPGNFVPLANISIGERETPVPTGLSALDIPMRGGLSK